MKCYVLDTSALLALIENESGADVVENLLIEGMEGRVRLILSVVALIQIFYISRQEQGSEVADLRLQSIDSLPIEQHSIHPDMARLFGEFKAVHSLSYADCCIAGLAKKEHAILVHKDPEYELLEREFEQIHLPYKSAPKSG